jgi:hypothetical protein
MMRRQMERVTNPVLVTKSEQAVTTRTSLAASEPTAPMVTHSKLCSFEQTELRTEFIVFGKSKSKICQGGGKKSKDV